MLKKAFIATCTCLCLCSITTLAKGHYRGGRRRSAKGNVAVFKYPLVAETRLHLKRVKVRFNVRATVPPAQIKSTLATLKSMHINDTKTLEINRFNQNKNYLGELPKSKIKTDLTEYGNLVLVSDGEVHPRVCTEALAAGLGVVISECGVANLDLSKPFITVIPDSKINDIKYIETQIIINRDYSNSHRHDILEYARQFDWDNIIEKYYIPSINEIKTQNVPSTT